MFDICYMIGENMEKKIPYGKQTILEEDIEAVTNVLKSDFITQGPEIPKFEKTLADYHGIKYGTAFSSGTAALHASYDALDVEKGDEIITSPITFAATVNAALYCGAKPVFVDIDPNTNCIDISKIEDKITKRTKVIVPVSLAGYPVEIKKICKLADKYDLKVLYDSAHAICSRRDGEYCAKGADITELSFHPVKHITCGEGGMSLTNSEKYDQKLKMFRSHGITKNEKLMNGNDGPWYYEMQFLGYNYRMTDIQAALGRSQFSRINCNIISRNRAARIYDDAFSGYDWMFTPPNVGFDILDTHDIKTTDNLHSYHLYTLQIKDSSKRRMFYDYLHERGIMVQVHYIPVHLLPYYRNQYGFKPGDYPLSESYYKCELSLPMYHNISDDEINYVIDAVKKFGKKL